MTDNPTDDEVQVEHITPEEKSLSTIQSNIPCDRDGCNRTFKSMSVLRFHQSQYHDHKKLKKLKRNHHIEERFHCPVKDCIYYYSACTLSKYFAKLQYLKQHYLKVHSVCSFPCNQCNKSFSTSSYLRTHQQYCDLDIVCSCEQRFGSIQALQTHVRRMGHESEVLEVYALRINERKAKKTEEVSKMLKSSKKQCLQSKGGSLYTSANPILPKSQPPHLVAAIALSELAFAGLKRVSTVEVGIQTESAPSRRLPRKSCIPIRSRESQSHKQKQTTEMETQTQLTNLKSKVRKKGNLKKVAKRHIATDTNVLSIENSLLVGLPSQTSVLKTMDIDSNYSLYNEKNSSSSSSNGEFFKGLTEKGLDHHFNSLGTQTTTSFDFDVFVPNNEGCLPYQLFRGESHPKESHDQSSQFSSSVMETSVQVESNEEFGHVIRLNVGEEPHQSTDIVSHFDSSHILIDDDDNFVSMSPSGRLSPVIPRRPPSLSAQNRSSSIETQTDYDVFLSTHNQSPEDADDIILTSSETQTCENFSDIEPFLCSTIHTQTVDEQHSSAELFPELNSFTTDMQTQTRMDDITSVVTTHTQTSVFGLTNS